MNLKKIHILCTVCFLAISFGTFAQPKPVPVNPVKPQPVKPTPGNPKAPTQPLSPAKPKPVNPGSLIDQKDQPKPKPVETSPLQPAKVKTQKIEGRVMLKGSTFYMVVGNTQYRLIVENSLRKNFEAWNNKIVGVECQIDYNAKAIKVIKVIKAPASVNFDEKGGNKTSPLEKSNGNNGGLKLDPIR